MKIKGGMVAFVAIRYQEEIIPKNYEVCKAIESKILSEKNLKDAYNKYSSEIDDCYKVVLLRDTLNALATSLDPKLEISWELLAKCLSIKGFNRDLIELVHSFFKLDYDRYREEEMLIQDRFVFDSKYNVYCYLTKGAYIGDLIIRGYKAENLSDSLTDNEYYAYLMAKGCELAIGPNLSDPFNVFKVGVYCANYEEMFDAGILDENNTMQDTLGETK